MLTLIKLLKMPKSLWWHLILAAIIGVIGHLCVIGISVVGGIGIVKIINHQTINIWMILIVMIILGIIRAISKYCEQELNHYVAFRLLASIRHDVYAKLRQDDLGYLQKQQKAKLLSVISNDVELLEVFFAHTISPVIIAFTISIIVLSIMYMLNPMYMVILLITFIMLAIIVPIIFYQIGKKNSDVNRELCSDMSNWWYQIINGWQSLVNNDNVDYLYQPMVDTTNQLIKSDEKNLVLTNLLKAITSIGISLCLVISVIYALHNHLKIDGLIIATSLIVSCFGPINSLTLLGNGLNNPLASAKRIISIMDYQPQVRGGNHQLEAINNIKIKDLTFGFDTPLYQNLNIEINQPGIYLISGVNGTGKSTLFKLLLHYYQINNQQIMINDVDLNEINLDSLHQHISIMEQTPFFFNASVKDNMLMVKPQASEEEIKQALKQAHVLETVMNQSLGLNTIVDDRRFSSGELQRLSLARMFLYDADVWLLDEPTTNLDSLNTGLIIDSLSMYQDQKIIIIISHQPQVKAVGEKLIELG